MSKITKDGLTLNPVWHKMLYSCTHNLWNNGRQRVKIQMKQSAIKIKLLQKVSYKITVILSIS